MKTLSILLFTLFLAIAAAEDASQVVSPDTMVRVEKVESKHETRSTKAYKRAKEACVKSSDGRLKGKKLTECIVNYQKETR